MFTFFDRQGPSRREFLRVGGLGAAGLTLPALLQTKAAAQSGGRELTTGKSVIFLFLHGGPSQYETFEPKMTAPEGIRSVTGEIQTSLPGVTFGPAFPKLARHAHRLTFVRSFQTERGSHDLKPLVCAESLDANVGSLYARVVGTTRPDGMPTNAAVFPNAVDPRGNEPITQFGRFNSTGSLGASYAPFIPGAGGQLQQNMQLNVARDRLDDRRALLGEIERLRRDMDAAGRVAAVDQFHRQAFDVILGGVSQAFDLSREDPRTVAAYDTDHLTRPDLWRHKNNRDRYTSNSRSLGKLLLLARRLCEAGCGFVTVSTNFVWDMHADGNNLGVEEGMDYVGAPLDHALSAFIDDGEARGLSDRILLVVTGEMGRTPRVNNRGGRDHWGKLTPLALYGGGLGGGRVIGRSSRDGGEPADTPLTSRHLIATIMHTVFDVPQVRLVPGIPTDVARVITADPIPGLW